MLKRVKENWSKLKASVAKKLGEPQLRQIRLYDLRHFAGSMTYYRTRGIIFTMRFLGHKNIKNTLRYIHLSTLIQKNTFAKQQQMLKKQNY